MEVVSFAKDVVQKVAEHAASYRIGQSALRHLDRALWVVEKCARWAVPPPLDQDERPQPELVRPLPWVFFLALLITLRVTRESISLINLVLGKPPLRSADVVMYIQSKRRYLRTLKYQGHRTIRARSAPAPSQTHAREPWYTRIQTLFEFTMCFRRQSHNYGNNNTTHVSNNDEVLVVKRSKRVRDPASPVPSTSNNPSEITMEKLIEKMMVDLDADSDEDSSFSLTNATSLKSDRSEESESEDEDIQNYNTASSKLDETALEVINVENNTSNIKGGVAMSTPEKVGFEQNDNEEAMTSSPVEDKTNEKETNGTQTLNDNLADDAEISEEKPVEKENEVRSEDAALKISLKPKKISPKEEAKNLIESERCSSKKSPQSPKNMKIANGRAMTAPNKKKGSPSPNLREGAGPVVGGIPADDS